MSITQLLAYQEKDKARMQILYEVETGKVKRELDETLRVMDTTKCAVSNLAEDANGLVSAIEHMRKSLKEAQAKVEEVNVRGVCGETELAQAIANASLVLGKLVSYENQLVDIIRKINDKSAQFEDGVSKMRRAQGFAQKLQPEYEKQKQAIAPKVEALNAELKKMESGIDAKILERYKKRRAQDKSGRPVDIVVKLVSERCGGCHFELPLSHIHKIGLDTYIVCEECGKIIYK